MAVSERISEIQNFLRNTPFFQEVSDEHVHALAMIGISQTYRRGETIFLEGDEGTGFFIIKSGRVKVFKVAKDGKEQILHIFGPEEYFAEVPAFDGGQFPASAAAIESAEVIFIPRATFLMVLEQHPTLAIALLGTFARHLRRLAHLVDSLSFKDVPERLANYLLNLSDRTNQPDLIELDLPKGQLAALLGTIPETLSRTFYKLGQEGVIEMNGTSIRLCDRDRLCELAHRD
jgi:CRP/FNR family transcriptional regulator, dissimilatory nitrate respiration regulator